MQQIKFTLGCILLAIFLAGTAPAKADSVPDDVEFALLKKFYDSLGGSAWTKKTNWPATGSWPTSATSAQFGTWYGVTVVDGDISQIIMSNNKLTGKIPANIGDLAALKVLDLNTNSISGSIPASLAAITTMQQIVISGCALTGTIPAGIFNNTGLQVFNISYNQFSGAIPDNITNATGLTSLILASNHFGGAIPAGIGNLVNLQNLTLWGNQLGGTIPVSITNLTNLTSLRLDQNRITGSIPSNIGNLAKLTQFYLYGNRLSGALPASLGNLLNLTDLQLYMNGFTGSIPSEIGRLEKVTTLRLDQNQLTGTIPVSLGNLKEVITLYMHNNQLTGTIPAELGNLVKLQNLYLSTNQLTGTIPESLGKLTNLASLYLHGNSLSGTIPASLGNLTKLQYLYLYTNKLTGALPKELGNLRALITLNVSGNQLSGEIPAEYSGLTNLQNLYLQSNRLSGALPPSLSALTKLRYFYVNDNALTGEVPSAYSSLTQLLALYLYNNQLSGELPVGLTTNWTRLAYFYIQNNEFTGDFPSSISTCTVLAGVNASGNGFVTMPAGLLNLAVLSVADFSNNELTSIPTFSGQVTNKANLTLKLSNNLLDFSVLEPLSGAGIKSLTIAPQKAIHDITSIKATEGIALVIPARNSGAHDVLTWEKQQPDGSWSNVTSLSQDATGKTFTRNAFAIGDEGVYRWTITNSVVTTITLQSESITAKLGSAFIMDNLAFQYRYDGRQRMVGKKTPGADWEYIVYDDHDRVIMTQDGVQRKNNKWNYTVYDALNRPIITGIYTHSSYLDQSEMAALIANVGLYETYTGNNANHGYSNTVFAATALVATGFDIQTVNYYDDYKFRPGWGKEYTYANQQVNSVSVNGVDYGQPATEFVRVMGKVTGVKVKTLEDQPRWLYAVNYYDDRYRVIQTVADNIVGGFDRVTTLFDFTGKILAVKSSHITGKLTWQNLYYAKADGDNLVKTTTTVTWGGASSVEQIPANQDGWVEATASDLVNNRFFGLSNQDTNPNFTSIKYSFYLTQGLLKVYVSGSPVYTVPASLSTGDRLRIARENGYINFYRNGIKVYPTPSAALLPSTESLLLDVSIGTVPGSVRYARVSSGQVASQAVTRHFDYDPTGRLVKIWHQVNNELTVLLVQNEYNELGQLVNKNLYSDDATGTDDAQRRFKQSIDYRYNIRGWITSINNSDLTNNSTNQDPTSVQKDLFGMELGYNQPIGTGNTVLYNGKISAVKWSNNLGLADIKENAYNYSYDPMERISQADYLQKKDAWGRPEYEDGNGASHTTSAYSETGYKYDLNGNIQALTRKAVRGQTIDSLTYFYGNNENRSNKLFSVTDAGDINSGFIDGNANGDDFTYDANGAIISDKNSNIASITYNDLSLPAVITKTNGDVVKYIYDASGRKLRKESRTGGALTSKTDYVGDYFYENDTLKYVNHEEGRVVMTGSTPEYQYFLKDHLGNIRMVFSTVSPVDRSLATFEPQNAVSESATFSGYEKVITMNSKLFDHTHVNDSTASTYYSLLLRGGTENTNERYSIAKSLSVMPGDTIKMEVFAKYIDPNNTSADGELERVLTAISNMASAPNSLIDGGAGSSAFGSAIPFAGLLSQTAEEDNGAPKAYLNWIIYDRDYNFKNAGNRRVTTAAAENGYDSAGHEQLVNDLLIEEAGYVYIYLSNDNETPVDVFFDDFKVEHASGPVVQQSDYYPLGTVFNSSSREGAMNNRFGFNGKEHQNDIGSGAIDFGARFYMNDIGRWAIVDPLSETSYSTSSYAYAFNNPVCYIDLEGLIPGDPKGNTKYTGSGNVIIIIKDGPSDPWNAGMLDLTTWDYGAFLTLQDAEDWLNSTYGSDGKTINNLVIRSHGDTGTPDPNAAGLVFHWPPQSATHEGIQNMIEKASEIKNQSTDRAKSLLAISRHLNQDATVVFTACGVSQLTNRFANTVFKVFEGEKKNLTIWTNQTTSSLKYENEAGDLVLFDKSLSFKERPWKPWTITTGQGSRSIRTSPGIGMFGFTWWTIQPTGPAQSHDKEEDADRAAAIKFGGW